MMRWEWTVEGRLETAVWNDGLFVSSSFGLEILADALVASQTVVECGLLGPYLEAGFGDEVVAWGTINEALIQYCEAVGPVEFNEWAVCPVIPEEENEDDNSFMSKVADALAKASFGGDRSAAGRYAANQRWQGQKKTELKIPVPTPKASDITKELKAYFGGSISTYNRSEGYKELLRKRELANSDGSEIGDAQLELIAEKQGFTGKPRVVSADEMDQLEKEGWTIAYRGISNSVSTTTSKPLKSEELAQEFVDGDYYGGFGTYANGTYLTDDLRVARHYAFITPSMRGTVMKVAIPPKVMLTRDKFLAFVSKKYDESLKHRDDRKHDFWGDDDLGRALAAKGYRGAVASEGVFVVWDRSMLAVQDSWVKDE